MEETSISAPKPQWSHEAVAPIIERVSLFRDEMLALESRAGTYLENIPAEKLDSARNLLHYVALRKHDIRYVQEQLVPLGLSSLGRCEAYVLANVEAVLRLLHGDNHAIDDSAHVDFARGRELLDRNTMQLFGNSPDAEPVIMVTLPSEASQNYELVRDMMAAGMNVVRINCAHDDESCWKSMIDNVRRAEEELRRTCRISMDLAGPKIRTGPIEPGPEVVRFGPERDHFGRVISPARVWASFSGDVEPHNDADEVIFAVDPAWKQIQDGDVLEFTDASERTRRLNVTSVSEHGFWMEAFWRTHITPDIEIQCLRDREFIEFNAKFGPIPPRRSFIVLQQGDQLVIHDPETPGRPAQYDEYGRRKFPASIGCTLPEIFKDVRKRDRVLLDDGKFAGVVEEAHDSQLVVRITRAKEGGQRLRPDKGMNFPDSELSLPALTEKDVKDLEFIAAHADIVNYSFVRRGDDIKRLIEELQRIGNTDLAIVLKIENTQAFENLPLLLLEVMSVASPTGVMIARGDLAVECGWERLVELQEEILWVCESAHMPVIWATQVLEGLAKNGLPTRAEISDAGMGARAECVMLNKGPNIVPTVQTLRDILRRMQEHQIKKRSTFRRLKMADRLFQHDSANESES